MSFPVHRLALPNLFFFRLGELSRHWLSDNGAQWTLTPLRQQPDLDDAISSWAVRVRRLCNDKIIEGGQFGNELRRLSGYVHIDSGVAGATQLKLEAQRIR